MSPCERRRRVWREPISSRSRTSSFSLSPDTAADCSDGVTDGWSTRRQPVAQVADHDAGGAKPPALRVILREIETPTVRGWYPCRQPLT